MGSFMALADLMARSSSRVSSSLGTLFGFRTEEEEAVRELLADDAENF